MDGTQARDAIQAVLDELAYPQTPEELRKVSSIFSSLSYTVMNVAVDLSVTADEMEGSTP